MSPAIVRGLVSGMLAIGAMGLAASACGAGTVPDTSASRSADSTLSWSTCAEARASRFECATLRVPLDYNRPRGRQIDLALIRLRATDPTRRLGSLVFNFGGPGGSGVSTLLSAAGAFGTLNRRYDLVSFDPRGVDRSSGITCLDGPEMDRFLAHEPSDTVERETRLITTFVRGCERRAGWLLPYVSTVNAARDMEAIRQALGEPRLNYFGFSYGTHLGAVYATRYPGKVGRMVLDSAVDPSVSMLDVAKSQALGFQQAYQNYLADCAKTATSCALGATVAAADASVRTLMRTAEATPLKVGTREVTEDVVRAGITQALYSKLAWPLLTDALTDARRGDASGLLSLADQYGGRLPDGAYTTLQSSLAAILCADTVDRPTVAQAHALAHRLDTTTPLFGPTAMSAGMCSLWPVPGDPASRHINASGAGPIIVVGVTNDPATPYRWAPRLARLLRTGVLLTLDGEGHGAYGQSGCIDTAVNAYLLDGTVPPNGLRC